MTTTEYRDPRARCDTPTGHQVHPYFMGKARAVLDGLGGPEVPHQPLAVWAEAARRRGADTTDGVIVARDGSLIAETRRVTVGPDALTATYVRADDLAAHGVPTGMDIVLDMAIAKLREALGQDVVHVGMSTVALGASRRPAPGSGDLQELREITARRVQASEDFQAVDGQWQATIRDLLAQGITQAQIADAAGVSRGRVNQIARACDA